MTVSDGELDTNNGADNHYSDNFDDRERPFDPEYDTYLASLASRSFEQLSREPALLVSEGNRIKQEMESVAFKNYKSFIHASDCVSLVRYGMSEISVHLNSTLNNLASLHDACSTFVSNAQETRRQQIINKTTLVHHTQLLELLEIPQLMDTFIRSELYEEALQLERHTAELKRTHGSHKVIESIVREVEYCTTVMLRQLHDQLRTKELQLPQCMKIVGYLRRLDLYSQTELELLFLRSRGAWLQSLVDVLATDNAYNFLTKMIDICRKNIFDIVIQYKSIFSDAQDELMNDGGLLSSWVGQSVSDFIQLLKNHMRNINDGRSISNLLDQCMWYGSSLGKLGVDFRGLLVPIFEDIVFRNFSQGVNQSIGFFQSSIKSYKFTPQAKSNTLPTLSNVTQNANDNQPSPSLMDFPPLALLTNGYLSSLNELRNCAPFSLHQKLSEYLNDSFERVAISLKQEEERRLDKEEEKTFVIMCQEAIHTHNVSLVVTLCLIVSFREKQEKQEKQGKQEKQAKEEIEEEKEEIEEKEIEEKEQIEEEKELEEEEREGKEFTGEEEDTEGDKED
ncbi:oligomeric Golgi complex subunit 8-like [Planoprotostelium fungivorum]|uniref:Conserved oligomeric Golgi complex subunit 8 n=1 Tax=Planoprotostelium fungivorum TaxID=1890364 RepID=A0A2P6NEC1_9EUKA|nr:oligomeric Golgi complex subunit 8-like [Planoprotostelium fungivorum]